MGVAYNTSIVREGLILHLDAANVKSYPGSGATWSDMSGNANHFTLNGVDLVESPSKHFSFGDNEGDSIARSATDVIGGLNIFTVDMFMRIDTIQNEMAILSYATSAQNNEFLFFQNGQNLNVFERGAAYAVAFATSNYNVGNFIQFSVVRNTSNHKIYVNGQYITQVTGTTATVTGGGAILFGQEQDSVLGGFQTTQDFPGDISSVKIYDRALSDAEIRQNFEAIRGRYGI